MHLKEKGFTLLEVLLTIGILGFTLVLTVPALDRAAAAGRLKSEAEQMAGVMRLARQEAVTSGSSRTIVFYSDGCYRVYNQSNHKFTSYRLNNGIQICGDTTFTQKYLSRPACTFTPLGNPVGAGTVTLKDSSGKQIYVITNPVQARIRVSFEPPANWK